MTAAEDRALLARYAAEQGTRPPRGTVADVVAPARFGHAGGAAWSADLGWHDAAPCEPGEILAPATRYVWRHAWGVTTPPRRGELLAGGRGAHGPEFAFEDRAAAIAALPADFAIFTAGRRVWVHWCIGLATVPA